jgi:hypothetical protein
MKRHASPPPRDRRVTKASGCWLVSVQGHWNLLFITRFETVLNSTKPPINCLHSGESYKEAEAWPWSWPLPEAQSLWVCTTRHSWCSTDSFTIGYIHVLRHMQNVHYFLGLSKSQAYYTCSRSQWPGGLWHEMFSLARTLGSWVRIPLKAWMSVCVYSMFLLGCGLAMG